MWKRSRFRFRTKYKQTLRLIISFTGLRGKKEVKKIVDVHSDEEEEEDDEDDTESDADKSGEDDMEEVRYPRWKRFSTLTLRSHVPFFAPFLSAALDFLMHFNIMCEQHHRNLFNPFLNGVKNVPCKSGLRVHLH